MSDPNHKAITTAEHHDIQRMHPLVSAAMAAGSLDPGTLRELLELQRDWERGEAKKAYTRALVALKRDMPAVIARDQEVDYTGKSGQRTRYRHTSLAAALDAVSEPLTAHGFSLAWEPRTEGNTVHVTCRLTHAEGHSETTTISAPVDTSGSKSPAQGVASTITLLSRYTALALLGIATADMRDPTGDPDPSRVDASRNLRAMAALQKYGMTVEDIEKRAGGPVSEWTAEDLDKLRAWAQELKGREA
jgi:ERF superfamily.